MSQNRNIVKPDQIEYKLLTEDKIEEAMSLQMQTMQQECVAIGVGIPEEAGASEEMNLIFREVIKDGVTMIAVDIDTNDLVAVAFNKLHVQSRDDEKDDLIVFMEENLKHQSCLELVKFLDEVESIVDVFDKYNVSTAMELFYLGTNPKYQGYGIGREIVKASIDLGRGLLLGKSRKRTIAGRINNEGVLPELIFGVFASTYSQRIVEKLGFDCLAEVRYEDYTCRGKRMSERIGEAHKTAKLAALKF